MRYVSRGKWVADDGPKKTRRKPAKRKTSAKKTTVTAAKPKTEPTEPEVVTDPAED